MRHKTLEQAQQHSLLQSQSKKPSNPRLLSRLAATATLLFSANTFIPVAGAASVDYLKGAGVFTSLDLVKQSWISVEPDEATGLPGTYDVTMPDGILTMTKKGDANSFFDDGFTYVFTDKKELNQIQPRHLHFEARTLNGEGESCDVRLYSVIPKEEAIDDSQSTRRLQDDDGEEEEEKVIEAKPVQRAPEGPNASYVKEEFSDILLFRFGWFNYMKLNTDSMIHRFEPETWYTVDLILDYETQRVSIYVTVEGETEPRALKSETFFTQRVTKLEGANALSIYGLTAGNTSQFRNIKLCDDICAKTEVADIKFEDLSGAASLWTSTSTTMLAGLTALVVAITA